jgi:hypothetical protein
MVSGKGHKDIIVFNSTNNVRIPGTETMRARNFRWLDWNHCSVELPEARLVKYKNINP